MLGIMAGLNQKDSWLEEYRKGFTERWLHCVSVYCAMLGLQWYTLCVSHGGNSDEFPTVSCAKWAPDRVVDSGRALRAVTSLPLLVFSTLQGYF